MTPPPERSQRKVRHMCSLRVFCWGVLLRIDVVVREGSERHPRRVAASHGVLCRLGEPLPPPRGSSVGLETMSNITVATLKNLGTACIEYDCLLRRYYYNTEGSARTPNS